ncbi:MAG: EF-hand domain-containing protein [Gemmatimonadetes bacterium]|nr:EF-hand domain-containing protein [Gemmatimonadota bacterium]
MKRLCIALTAIASCLWVWLPMAHTSQVRPVPDFDQNGVVDFPDFLLFVGKFGSKQGDETYEDRFDLDGNGTIDFSDFLSFVNDFGKKVPRIVDMMIDLPIRAISASGDWGTNEVVVRDWERAGRSRSLIPLDYIEWLKSLHVNWVGLAVQLYYDDSLDSTVDRVTSSDPDFTFSDGAVRQLIREFRSHRIDVYLTLALNDHSAVHSARPAPRWLLGLPYLPENILPENWPWSKDHPDHQRFVAEFWETYTQQAVHFARIAEDEGPRLYSLGTESDMLFRTRAGDPNNPEQSHMTNHFGQELKALVERVRAVYSGLLSYDMHYDALKTIDHYGQGSGAGYLWEDLDLDIVGISAWFPLLATTPTTPISVETAQMKYEQIFSNYLKPLAERNPNRLLMFLEYGAVDVVSAPIAPDHSDFSEYVFTDSNGNGLDDGRETQANMYQGLINAMTNNPGLLNGIFYWDNWIASDGLWAEWWAGRRSFAIRGKLAEEVVRSAYASYAESSKDD